MGDLYQLLFYLEYSNYLDLFENFLIKVEFNLYYHFHKLI